LSGFPSLNFLSLAVLTYNTPSCFYKFFTRIYLLYRRIHSDNFNYLILYIAIQDYMAPIVSPPQFPPCSLKAIARGFYFIKIYI
jgi:hypothetical protein